MMTKYLEVSFHTIKGIKKLIDLGGSAYGEWIVYDDEYPVYHIRCFDINEPSNIKIKELIENNQYTISQILKTINNQQSINLSLGQRPVFESIENKELIDLDLGPLPEIWLNNI
ncbi:MAG TPA: hypothetical protein VHC47_02235 [Mucilaginibacter sp.]|nr:hypothetical protein [Mucilaginibacter sp.]